MFREENHGNVYGILTLEIWKEKKKWDVQKQVAVNNWDSVFSCRKERQNVHELAALVNTLSTAS